MNIFLSLLFRLIHPEKTAQVGTMEEMVSLIESKHLVLDLKHPSYVMSREINMAEGELADRFRNALRINPPIYSHLNQV